MSFQATGPMSGGAGQGENAPVQGSVSGAPSCEQDFFFLTPIAITVDTRAFVGTSTLTVAYNQISRPLVNSTEYTFQTFQIKLAEVTSHQTTIIQAQTIKQIQPHFNELSHVQLDQNTQCNMETVGGTAASVGNNYTDATLSFFSAGAGSPLMLYQGEGTAMDIDRESEGASRSYKGINWDE